MEHKMANFQPRFILKNEKNQFNLKSPLALAQKVALHVEVLLDPEARDFFLPMSYALCELFTVIITFGPKVTSNSLFSRKK